MISVIVPVYNEIKTVLELIARVRAVSLDKEIIVVDDGSTDGSYEAVKGIEGDGLKVYRHEKNIGKGMAVRTGIDHAAGDIILIQDADLELDPNEYHELIAPIVSGVAKVVYGSRILGMKKHGSAGRVLWFYAGGRLLTFIANLLYGISITDEPTCYKVFDASVIKSIRLDCRGFEFCPEITAKLARLGIPIHEVPISYYPRSVKEGKKVRLKDAVKAVMTLLKYRFASKDGFIIEKGR